MNEMNIELFEKLSRLQWLLHKQHLRNHNENGPMADPTRGQGRILAILKMQDGISTKDLSYLLGIRVSSLNELLSKLEKSGFIIRESSEADKRVMIVKLTEKGKNEQQQERDFSDMFSCLFDDEQKIFGEYLDRVITSLTSELGDDGDETGIDWWNQVRERMGGEMFEKFASLRRSGFDPRQGFAGFPHRGPFGGPGMTPQPPKGPHDSEKE